MDYFTVIIGEVCTIFTDELSILVYVLTITSTDAFSSVLKLHLLSSASLNLGSPL